MCHLKYLAFVIGLVSIVIGFNASAQKRTIGPVEYVQIEEADNMAFLTRIDTGAAKTSLHAFDIRVDDDAGRMQANIGKTITFKTMNEKQQFHTSRATIVGVQTIRNSQGKEQRYEVELTLTWQGKEKKVLVNLRNRQRMDYKLLIGRNWLAGDYLVDVEQPPES